MVQDTVNPTLTSAEVDDLLLLARRTDAYGNAPEDTWQPSTIYQAAPASFGPLDALPVNAQRVVPVTFNGHVYATTVAGISGTVEPVWPITPSATIVDGTVTWQEAGAYLWSGTWSLAFAAATGWRWKAGKVSDQYTVGLGTGDTFAREQLMAHCLQMADRYGRSVVGSVQIETASTAVRSSPQFSGGPP